MNEVTMYKVRLFRNHIFAEFFELTDTFISKKFKVTVHLIHASKSGDWSILFSSNSWQWAFNDTMEISFLFQRKNINNKLTQGFKLFFTNN